MAQAATNATAAAIFQEGDRVVLLQAIAGSEENDHVFGSAAANSNASRKAVTKPAGHEVFIHKIRNLPMERTSAIGQTAGGNEVGAYKMYSFKEPLATRYTRFVATGGVIKARIPHASLSKAKGGKPDATLFELNQYAWVVVEHSWTYQGKPASVKAGQVIQIASEPLTNTGRAVDPNSVRRLASSYEFKITSEVPGGNKTWTSAAYHFPGDFVRA